MKKKDLEQFSDIAGFVTVVVNPLTGIGFVAIYDREKGFEIDADFRWITSCETHGVMVSSKTLQLARESMWSVDFCEACQRSEHLAIHSHPELL